MKTLRKLNLSYNRSYGGKWEQGTKEAEPKIGEKSFIVYNYNTATGKRFTDKEFRNIAVMLYNDPQFLEGRQPSMIILGTARLGFGDLQFLGVEFGCTNCRGLLMSL